MSSHLPILLFLVPFFMGVSMPILTAKRRELCPRYNFGHSYRDGYSGDTKPAFCSYPGANRIRSRRVDCSAWASPG